MRKWLWGDKKEGGRGDKSASCSSSKEDDAETYETSALNNVEGNVDKALMDLIEDRKMRGTTSSFHTTSRSLKGEDGLSKIASRSTRSSAESPWGTYNNTYKEPPGGYRTSMSPRERDRLHEDRSGGLPSMAIEKSPVKATFNIPDHLFWVCGICGQKDNAGETCSVCKRQRGASLARSYMTVDELTSDVIDGIKRQKDYHNDKKVAKKELKNMAKTDGAWHSSAVSQVDRVQHARTQVQWADLNKGAQQRTPFAGGTSKSATFSGTSKSTGSMPTSPNFRSGPAPPLPSFHSMPPDDGWTTEPRMPSVNSMPSPSASSTAAGPAMHEWIQQRQGMNRSSSTPAVLSVPDKTPAMKASANAPPLMPGSMNRGMHRPKASMAATHAGNFGSHASFGAGHDASSSKRKQGLDSRSPSGTPPVLKPGTSVAIRGLAPGGHLNGSVGTVRQWDRSSGKWVVDLPSGERKTVRHEDLEVLRPAPGMGGTARAPSPKEPAKSAPPWRDNNSSGPPAPANLGGHGNIAPGGSASMPQVGPPPLPHAMKSQDSVSANSAALNAMASTFMNGDRVPPGFREKEPRHPQAPQMNPHSTTWHPTANGGPSWGAGARSIPESPKSKGNCDCCPVRPKPIYGDCPSPLGRAAAKMGSPAGQKHKELSFGRPEKENHSIFSQLAAPLPSGHDDPSATRQPLLPAPKALSAQELIDQQLAQLDQPMRKPAMQPTPKVIKDDSPFRNPGPTDYASEPAEPISGESWAKQTRAQHWSVTTEQGAGGITKPAVQKLSKARPSPTPTSKAMPSVSGDDDPMAMLMAQMHNLDRLKGKMQSSCA